MGIDPLGEAGKLGQNIAFKNKWIVKREGNVLVRNIKCIRDEIQNLLEQIHAGILLNEETLKDLKKRKLVDKMFVFINK